MSEKFNPARRRVIAGLAALGLAQPVLGQTQSSTPPKPQCRIPRTNLGGTVYGDGMVYFSSDYKKIAVARFTLSPSKVIEHGLKMSDITFSRPSMKFTRTNRQQNGGDIGSLDWREWTARLARISTTDGTRNMQSLKVTIGDDQGLVFRNISLSFTNSSGGMKESAQTSWSDNSYYAKNKFVDWLKNNRSGKNLIVFAQDPSNSDLWIRYYYSKATILKLMKKMDPKTDRMLADANSGKCTPVTLSSPCFLTTAACGTVGLADDCWELRTLRQFRDGWLAQQPGGERDIEIYYNTAPGIVDAVSARPDAQAIWLSVYWRHIVPSALMVRLGLRNTARRHYTRMMHRMIGFCG